MCAQSNQLRGWEQNKAATEPETGPAQVQAFGMKCAGVGAVIAGALVARKPLMNFLGNATGMPAMLTSLPARPAGPFFIHFWAPNFKWMLSVNHLLDYNRPVENISMSMTSALTMTGLIFMRWSFVIIPVNYSLFAVNLALSASSGYHLARKIKADYFDKK